MGPSPVAALRADVRRGRRRFDVEAADRPPHRPPHEQDQQGEQAVLERGQGERRHPFGDRHGARLADSPLRNSSTVVPIVMLSPSESAPDWTVWPFSRVPFVDPRSVSVVTPSFVRRLHVPSRRPLVFEHHVAIAHPPDRDDLLGDGHPALGAVLADQEHRGGEGRRRRRRSPRDPAPRWLRRRSPRASRMRPS